MIINSLKWIIVLTTIMVSGCTSTMKFNNNLTKSVPSPHTASIKVSRSSSWLAGAHVIGIQDSTIKIGELGPGGELSWNREAGYVAIITSFGSYTPTHVLIFPVEAGKSYELKTEIHSGVRCSSNPVNFPQNSVVFEKLVESRDTPLNDSWKTELARLNSQPEGLGSGF